MPATGRGKHEEGLGGGVGAEQGGGGGVVSLELNGKHFARRRQMQIELQRVFESRFPNPNPIPIPISFPSAHTHTPNPCRAVVREI